ncbi:MAG: tryptophan synthase subunit alpha [Lachnospiraceae bacterium]|nr:tryptophan synthase subunit alpha [Lachnospiraceae bacterium]
MSKIAEAFNNKKAFIPFITCGYPDLETTKKIVKACADNGAALIELGIPFSDPTAEGPVIQGANIKALEGGVTTDKIFEMVREIRKEVTIPMVFMTYANVVYSYGMDDFCRISAEVGMDGIILPDVPYEEKEEFDPTCKKYGLDFISLIAPTSEERISMIASEACGFIYVVSSLGVTGVRTEIKTDINSIVAKIRENTNVPCAVGFGISKPEQARKMSEKSDGAIVGSAIIKIIAEHGRDSAAAVGEYVKSMVDAVNENAIENIA